MAKHRRQTTSASKRGLTAASSVIAGATLVSPATAGAAEVRVPNTNLSAYVPGIDTVPGIENVPGIDQWVPSLAGKAAPGANFNAAVKGAVPAPVQPQGQRIVEIAKSKIGSPYVYGAAGPQAFDCSGFTSWVYAQAGKSIPRTSGAQASAGQRVDINALQPGDIVVYYGGASHVGIYAGNGQIIDALNSGTPVGYRPLNYMPIHSAVRF